MNLGAEFYVYINAKFVTIGLYNCYVKINSPIWIFILYAVKLQGFFY